MTQELTALPESFPAGTTVTYLRTVPGCPASAGCRLTLYLGGPKAQQIEATAEGDAFRVTISASLSRGLPAGRYPWAERLSNDAGTVRQVREGATQVTPDIAQASDGDGQEWLEKVIPLMERAILEQSARGIISYQLSGIGVVKETPEAADRRLQGYRSQLFHLQHPEQVTRSVLVSFTPLGFDR